MDTKRKSDMITWELEGLIERYGEVKFDEGILTERYGREGDNLLRNEFVAKSLELLKEIRNLLSKLDNYD